MAAQSSIPSDLLSHLYATATDKSAWPAFCAALNRHTDAPVKIFGHSVDTAESLGFISAGWCENALGEYHAYYGALNPWMHMNLALKPGMVGVSDDALPREELFKTEFYNDWLRHQEGIVAGPAMLCYRTSRKLVAMVAACRARAVDEKLPHMVSLLEALSPHVTQAIRISGVLSAGGGYSPDALEASRHAIITVRESGRVAGLNAAASRVLRETPFLKVGIDETLRSSVEDVQGFIARASRAMAGEAFDADMGPVPFHTSSFGRCLLHAHIFPERAELEFPDAVWCDRVAGCFVITGPFGLDQADTVSILIVGFGATPAEARLGLALCGGRTLYEYADAAALSRHTVRNQMRVLLEKTGARNQADFVRRVLRLASPFLSGTTRS
ncbi:MAG: helix-turn-helix transcriptional regulator [Pseudomonadota bacterium]